MDGLPPHNVSAEEAVLASCLLADVAAKCRVLVRAEDFFREQNGWIYEAILELDDRGEEVTIPSVAHELGDRLDECGGEPYLVELTSGQLTALGVETHCKIVARLAYYRRLIQAGSKIAQIAYEEKPNHQTAFSEAFSALLSVRHPDEEDGPQKLGWNKVFQEDEGVRVGIPVIDNFMLGLGPGKVTALAGPSGFGKSLMAGQIALNAAQEGASTLIISMEMNGKEYEERMVRNVAQLDHRPVTDEDWQDVHNAQAYIESLPVKFWHKPRVTLEQVRARATAIKADEGLNLLVVDYLQLMGLPSGRESEATKIGTITSGLKNLAVELGIHVLLLSQMNRGAAAEMRGREATKKECLITGDKYAAPFIESMKGSGSIEQDADAVLILTKHPDCVPGRHLSLVLAKNRSGETGECILLEDYARSTFSRMTVDEIYRVASGDMYKSKSLLSDQGYGVTND